MKSDLTKGNAALKNGDYAAALTHYRRAIENNPEQAALLNFNIKLAERGLKKKADSNGAVLPASGQSHKSVSIDVVVPVYNALEDVMRCLQSIEKNCGGFQVQVIVVNDASSPETSDWLRSFCAGRPLFRLIENESNQGYTKTVNTGLRASKADYVITQNSDTVVTAGWLEGMVNCMLSNPRIGIVGPLSNAASWQNVPVLKDDSGGFAVNKLPSGLSVDEMARVVASVSAREYPRLPFVNGFCFMIRKSVIETIGYMDEDNFPVGYGEENDFCIRAVDAGFELVIADDVFVFHAKSKSFGHEKRKLLSDQGSQKLREKHGRMKYDTRLEKVKETDALDRVRARIRVGLATEQHIDDVSLTNMRILFLLPVKGGGGGAHSVVQEVAEMRRLGVDALIGMRHEQIGGFLNAYADISDASNMFIAFDDQSLIEIASSFDIVVGTVFSSMRLVKRVADVLPYVLPAYYVQDYEPMFFSEGSLRWKEARDSYTLVPHAFLFAKTKWIVDRVLQEHGMKVCKVQPSIDHVVYVPKERTVSRKIVVSAMIRPQTPYRGAERTMRLLRKLHELHGNAIDIRIFGCDEGAPEFGSLERRFPYTNLGVLLRPQVASLLADSDLFIDLSDYQAFGRTALEAMACGCAAVVPSVGGSDEYAVHLDNALILDTFDEDLCLREVSRLISNPSDLFRMSRNALLTAARYSVHAAAVSELVPMEAALKRWRISSPKINKASVILIPSLRADGVPTGSGFVRVSLPFKSPDIVRNFLVSSVSSLPKPGSGDLAVIQREVGGVRLEDLKRWVSDWKARGGKILYEIDDDLLDEEGLRLRHYSGDLSALVGKVRFLAANADSVNVSTEALRDCLSGFNKNVVVVPNALDADLWGLSCARIHTDGPYARRDDGPIRIGYIGTPTHDEDLKLIKEAMLCIEKKYGSRIEIEVIGGFQKCAPMFGKRVSLPKANDYPSFVHWLKERVHWDIGIIPLASSRFNESKSYLKFLEYAALDLAIVVSEGSTYSPVARHRENSLVVPSVTEAWVSALSELIEQRALRIQYASAARIDLIQRHTLSKVSPCILDSIRQLMLIRRGESCCG